MNKEELLLIYVIEAFIACVRVAGRAEPRLAHAKHRRDRSQPHQPARHACAVRAGGQQLLFAAAQPELDLPVNINVPLLAIRSGLDGPHKVLDLL